MKKVSGKQHFYGLCAGLGPVIADKSAVFKRLISAAVLARHVQDVLAERC
jgi:hypothetical protein